MQASYRLMPEAVCCCLQTCKCGFDVVLCTSVPSLKRKPNQVIGINISVQVLMPEAVCCCLQTCKCGFDIRAVLCASVPSLIVSNANTTKL